MKDLLITLGITTLILDAIGFILLILTSKKKKKKEIEKEYIIKGSKEDVTDVVEEKMEEVKKPSGEMIGFITEKEENKIEVEIKHVEEEKGKNTVEDDSKEIALEKKERLVLENIDVLKEQPESPFDKVREKEKEVIILKHYEPLKYEHDEIVGTNETEKEEKEENVAEIRVKKILKDLEGVNLEEDEEKE